MKSDYGDDDLEAYFLLREFREPARFRCSDGMCGADDCARCHPEGDRMDEEVNGYSESNTCPACGGLGWLLVDIDRAPAIQRCDACRWYESDNEAVEAVARDARCWHAYLKRNMS